MSSFSSLLDELCGRRWDLEWLITKNDETRRVRWILSDPWSLVPPPWLCRWFSAGRTARSTSSEDGSLTARDLARSPANTGSVSGSAPRLAKRVTHAEESRFYPACHVFIYFFVLWWQVCVNALTCQQHNDTALKLKAETKKKLTDKGVKWGSKIKRDPERGRETERQ